MRERTSKFMMVFAAMVLTLPFQEYASANQIGNMNVALGKKYTLTPAPSYSLCSDEDDIKQLTDGIQVDTSDKLLWIDKGCVGWVELKPVEVVIDLEKIYAIDSVVLFSGANPRSGGYLPSITVAVSDDGEDFWVVRRLDNSKASHNSRAVLKMENLKARGRYVMLRLAPPYGSYVWADEIQVFRRGDHNPHDLNRPELTPLKRLKLDSQTYNQKVLLNSLNHLATRVKQTGLQNKFAKSIANLTMEVSNAPTVYGRKLNTMDTDLALELRKKVEALQDKVIRAVTEKLPDRLAVWSISPWAKVLPGDFPPPAQLDLKKMRITAGQKEYESQAFMITNFSDSPKSVNIRLQGQLSQPKDWKGRIDLRQVVFHETTEKSIMADALPLLDHPLIIPSRQSRQVWLDIYTADTSPGEYEGQIVLTSDVGKTHKIELALEVLPVSIPDEVPLATYSWQYLDIGGANQDITEYKKEAIADLKAHYNNVNIISNNTWARPRKESGDIDEQGNIIKETDFTKFDRWVELLKSVSTRGFIWYPSFAYKEKVVKDSPRYRTYSQHLRNWVAHLKELGLGYDDFCVYPVDEDVISEDFFNSAKAIRSVDPKIKIFSTSMARDSDDLILAAAPYVDVWCITPPERHPEQVDLLNNTGSSVWSYFVSRRIKSPYVEFRLFIWKAFKKDITGCGFWAYSGNQRKSKDQWNGSEMDYSVIYTRDGAPEGISQNETVIPSKRWQSWREGIEDYTYLHMLREAIKKSNSYDQKKRARKVLGTAIEEVLSNPEDLTLADKHRQKIIRAIVSLK